MKNKLHFTIFRISHFSQFKFMKEMVYGWFSVFSSEKSVFSSEKCGKQYIEPHFAFLAD